MPHNVKMSELIGRLQINIEQTTCNTGYNLFKLNASEEPTVRSPVPRLVFRAKCDSF